MENSVQPQGGNFEKAEIFETPEQLAASMQSDAQTPEPQVEAQPEQPAETP